MTYKVYIYYQRDRIAYDVGVFFQCAISAPVVCSLYHKITTYMCVGVILQRHSRSYFIILWYNPLCNQKRDIVLHVIEPNWWYFIISSTDSSFLSWKCHNECINSLSMRPYCMACRKHFSTPGVISSYYRITPHTNAWEAFYNMR